MAPSSKPKKLAAAGLYVSVDMEGLGGVSHEQDVCAGSATYPATVEALEHDLIALTKAAGALSLAPVTFNDAHATMQNLSLAKKLINSPGATVLVGKPKRFGMMAGLTPEHKACVLWGYHGKAGSVHSPLAHTFSPALANITLNGVSLGEVGLNLLLAQWGFKVPVWLVVGDAALEEEVKALGLKTPPAVVITKTGIGFSAAYHRPSQQVLEEALNALKHQQRTQTGSEDEAGNRVEAPPPYLDSNKPWELTLSFHTPVLADWVALLPQAKRMNGTTLRWGFARQEPNATPQQVLAQRLQLVYQTVQSAYTLASVGL